MSIIEYVSPFVPPEWIAAHGHSPRRAMPCTRNPETVLRTEAGICTFAAAFANNTSDRSSTGVVFTTTCDAMRRASESVEDEATLFVFNVPATWQTVASQQLYVSELRRLSRWLVERGGRMPDREHLVTVMRQWDEARSSARAARPLLRARDFAEAMPALHETGRFAERTGTSVDTTGLPVALVGGPLLQNDLWLYDTVETAGARIVLDAMETGERGLAPPFDRRQLQDDPLLLLADAYFGRIPDAFRRPNSHLYEYLQAGFSERGVRAVILVRRVACDLWRAETARIRDWCGLPCVDVDLAGEGDVRVRTQTAVQTLCEGRA